MRICCSYAVAQQKKLKLPSTRVGAKFDRHGPSADNWLPSFGRVWSKNCRTHNQYAYLYHLYYCVDDVTYHYCWDDVVPTAVRSVFVSDLGFYMQFCVFLLDWFKEPAFK